MTQSRNYQPDIGSQSGSPAPSISSAELTDRPKAIILAVVGLFYSVAVAYLSPILPNRLYTDDFIARWYASRMLLTTGRGLYDWANAYELMDITRWPLAYDLRFYYPASLLLFTGPLGLLPYRVAVSIWIAFGLWCLWLSMVIFARLRPQGWPINRLTVLLLLFTTSVPVMQHTLNAQFNTLIVLMLALTYWALFRQKYLLAGLAASGLLLKPQAGVVPFFLLAVWVGLAWERRAFWLGLVLAAIPLWAVPELLEPRWVITFLQGLSSYPPVLSVVDRFWNPYQIVSIGLVLLTLWFVFRLRNYPASSVQFGALLAWIITLAALIVPMFSMVNIVSFGPVFIILVNGFTVLYPAYSRRVWLGIVGFLIVGLAAFVTPLVLNGPDGSQIGSAEMVYRFSLPVVLSLAALPLILHPKVDNL